MVGSVGPAANGALQRTQAQPASDAIAATAADSAAPCAAVSLFGFPVSAAIFAVSLLRSTQGDPRTAACAAFSVFSRRALSSPLLRSKPSIVSISATRLR